MCLWATLPLWSQQAPGVRPFDVEIVDGRLAVAGEALVKFRAGARAGELSALDVEATEPAGMGLRRVRAPETETAQLVAALEARGDVAFAEPNFVAHLDSLPNDPQFPDLWGLLNRALPGADIAATDAWALSTGSKGHAVAVIDTGIDYTHPDLAPNVWSAPAPYTVTVRGVSVTCGRGTHGFDAITLTCDPMDDHGHGTRMAGVIGAAGNNGFGVTGVNWDTSLVAVKFLGADGFGTYADAIAGLEYLLQLKSIFPAAADVRVISNSWGGGGSSEALLDQIERTAAADILFVAAAGNDGADNDIAPHYPSNFEVPSIVAVTATTKEDFREAYASFGATTVDLGAPGPLNRSTGIGGAYQNSGGTSTATAFVSGAAALLLSHCGLDTAALKGTLLDTVDPLPALSGMTVTGGRLNAGRAMRRCAAGNSAPSVRMTAPSYGAFYSGPATITLAAEAGDTDGRVVRVDFYAADTFVGSDATAPFKSAWSGAGAGAWAVYAIAHDDRGATARSATVTVTVTPAPGSLPSPWATRDIGATGRAGTAWMQENRAVVEGAGIDIWNGSDELRFLYQPLTGDGEIVARVASLEAINAWSKAGVMIRQTLSASSAHAFMLVSPGKGLAFQRRLTAGALSAHTSGGSGTAPAWVRLVRSGSTITASRSRDGVTWTVVGRDTFTMGPTVYVGLAVVSRDRSRLATAIFEDIRVRGGAPAPGPTTSPSFQSADIGAAGVAGGWAVSGDTHTVRGAGADVWGAADAFRYVYRPLEGDGRIVARVTGVEHVNPWTKVGVMMRQSLTPGSPHAFMLVSAGKGLAYQRRLAAGGLSTHTSGGTGTAPRWVQLVRTGQVITASVSADGVTWTKVGQSTFAMPATIWVGLAVSSHDPARAAAGTFTNVSIYD